MPVIFPDIKNADPNGLLAISKNLNIEMLLTAYNNGIFPWPYEENHILWFAPPQRAVLEFNQLKISKRLLRHLKNKQYDFRINTAFEKVINYCALIERPDQDGTWITGKVIDAYIELHKAGYAHSFEIFSHDNQLTGGLYGVKINNFFAGESMFHLEANTSKFALYETVNYLKAQGLTWLDAQITNPFLKKFGIKEISRNEFMAKLKETLN